MSPATDPAAPEPTPAAVPSTGDQATSQDSSQISGATAAASAKESRFGPDIPAPPASPAAETGVSQRPRKGPLSFLSGALTSGLLAWLSLGLSQKVVAYYAEHPPHYSAQIAQSIATALKTLIVGMCFLATFSFAFIGLGLFLTFLRSLLPGRQAEAES